MILFKEFEKTDLDFETIEVIDTEWTPEFADAVEESKLAITGVVDGEPIACSGVHPIDDFSGEIWIRLGKWCKEHRIETLKWIMSGLEIIEKTYPFKQLNAHVKEGFCESEKLLRFLGFTEVGLENGYTVFAKRVQE